MKTHELLLNDELKTTNEISLNAISKRIIATVLTFLYVVFLNIGANAQTADVLKASLISSSVSGMPYQTLKIKIEYIITNQKGTDFSIKTKSNSKVVFDGADTIYPKPKTDDFGICTWEGRKAYE